MRRLWLGFLHALGLHDCYWVEEYDWMGWKCAVEGCPEWYPFWLKKDGTP
jgi:hypothetical protein